MAYFELETSVSASGSITFTYDNPKALTIRNVGVSVKNFSPATLDPELSIELNKEIVPKVEIKGDVKVTGFIRVGPEVTLEVNGMSAIVTRNNRNEQYSRAETFLFVH